MEQKPTDDLDEQLKNMTPGQLDGYLKEHEDACPYLQFKMDYLCVDLIRLLHRQHHRKEFRMETVQILRDLGYFPLRPHPELKYKLFSLLTRCIY